MVLKIAVENFYDKFEFSGRPIGTVTANSAQQLEEFDWADYLKETESVPAPPQCFKQVS